MSVNAGLGKLKRAEKDLRARWSEVKGHWYDENSRHFEERRLTPLLARLRMVQLTMGQMATVLQKVRHDCG